MIAKGDEVNAW